MKDLRTRSMKLTNVTICNFRSFGPEPTSIDVSDVTYLIGPNGAGKTAVLQALARMFAVDSSLRGIRAGDFHVPDAGDCEAEPLPATSLWIETEFALDVGEDGVSLDPAVPEFLAQMRMEAIGGPMIIRMRLTAERDDDDEIEERLQFVQHHVESDEHRLQPVSQYARRRVQLHYLPARRDPGEQISYAPKSLLGNALRAADLTAQTAAIHGWNQKVADDLADSPAIRLISEKLTGNWAKLHSGATYSSPTIGVGEGNLDLLLRQLTVNFSPSPSGSVVNYSMLSDGQQSLLYLTTVLAIHQVGRTVHGSGPRMFDEDKFRPPVYTMLAFEEPENSLSPFYLGRVLNLLAASAQDADCQSIVATHAPAVVNRVDPERIRHLRLDESRRTRVTKIRMPENDNDAYKFIQQAVWAYPELYFARLVVLGEGASEEVFLPRLLSASGAEADANSVAVVPLGGRHVNHMWRLLNELDIPHLTLIDLDRCRFGGGWGRVRTAVTHLQAQAVRRDVRALVRDVDVAALPKWLDHDLPMPEDDGLLNLLEAAGVFFSAPLDLDFLLLEHYPHAYPSNQEAIVGETDDDLADDDQAGQFDDVVPKVLGKKHGDVSGVYSAAHLALFERYHSLFQLGSKPAAHLTALGRLDDQELLAGLPSVMRRLTDRAKQILESVA